MRVFLHIGIDKCGSTSIQSGLFKSREKLRKAGISVPDLDFSEKHGHGALFRNLFGPREPLQNRGSADDAKTAAQSLQRELQIQKKKGIESVILTWEGLNFLKKKEITTLAKILAGHAVTLIVYVREQASIAQSGALQNIKVPFHGCRPIISIRNDPDFLPGPSRNYFALLKPWKKLMKPDDIVVRRYDRNSLVRGDAFTDLLSVITRIELQDLGLNVNIDERNTSIDVPSALVLDSVAPYIGRGTPKYYSLSGVLLNEIERNGMGLKYFLSERQVANIRAHYHKTNKMLASAFLNSNAPLFCSEPRPICSTEDFSEARYQAAEKLRSVVAKINRFEIDCEKLAMQLEAVA